MLVFPHLHGGYLARVSRADRASSLQSLIASAGPVVAIAPTRREAEDLGERLRLSGVPVSVATSTSVSPQDIDFGTGRPTSLVASQEWILAAGPIEADVVVHTRLCRGSRDYARRLRAVQSPVHVSFVVAEDERLLSQLGAGDTAGVNDIDLREVIASSTDAPVVPPAPAPRRRFPISR